MTKVSIVIDGYIGSFGYSKQWLKEMLKGHEKNQINLTLSSLGGSVDHALAMHEMLKRHGNVHVILSGFNASASTIVAMGGNTRSMSKYGFFLVHKVMSWVDEFGYMNEDDIESLISRLEKEKNENAKMTLALAQVYHDEIGKPTKDLLNLMKQDTWLGADEAKEWGFVNEVYTPSADEKAAMYDMAKVAMIEANGLPNPVRASEAQTETQASTQGIAGIDSETFLSRIINQIKETFKPTKKPMQNQFVNINQAIGVESIEASEEGIYLNEEQLQTIDALVAQVPALTQERDTQTQAVNTITAERDQLMQERNTLSETVNTITAERDQAQQALDDLINLLNAIDQSVAAAEDNAARVAALRTLIARKPGAAPAGQNAAPDPDPSKTNDGVDWDTLNSLPHMQEE